MSDFNSEFKSLVIELLTQNQEVADGIRAVLMEGVREIVREEMSNLPPASFPSAWTDGPPVTAQLTATPSVGAQVHIDASRPDAPKVRKMAANEHYPKDKKHGVAHDYCLGCDEQEPGDFPCVPVEAVEGRVIYETNEHIQKERDALRSRLQEVEKENERLEIETNKVGWMEDKLAEVTKARDAALAEVKQVKQEQGYWQIKYQDEKKETASRDSTIAELKGKVGKLEAQLASVYRDIPAPSTEDDLSWMTKRGSGGVEMRKSKTPPQLATAPSTEEGTKWMWNANIGLHKKDFNNVKCANNSSGAVMNPCRAATREEQEDAMVKGAKVRYSHLFNYTSGYIVKEETAVSLTVTDERTGCGNITRPVLKSSCQLLELAP